MFNYLIKDIVTGDFNLGVVPSHRGPSGSVDWYSILLTGFLGMPDRVGHHPCPLAAPPLGRELERCIWSKDDKMP